MTAVSKRDRCSLAPLTNHSCIHTWFEAQVEKTPDAIALAFNGQTLTYRELNQRANQLAHYLIDQGIQAGDLVAISMHRCFEMVVSFWGVLKAGAAYVPIDPTYPAERQAFMLQDCQARILLTQQSLASEQAAIVLCLDTDWQTAIAPFPCENPNLEAQSEQLAYVIYTSGSTGKPKGVKISHRGIINHSRAIVDTFELMPRDRVLQFSSISFDIIVEEVYPALVTGASVVLRTEEIASSIRQFLTFVETNQITVLDLPTAFWHELVNSLSLLNLRLPASVRLVVVGGEKASRITYAEWIKLVGHYPRWLNTYGPTEATVTTTIYDPIVAGYDPEQGEIPIGKPLANTEVYILNDKLQPVPCGEVGELYIGGLGVALEYHNRPDHTAAKFIPNPFSQEPSRLYKTGDTVRCLPDGNLEFIGRIDFQVKIRGFRIEMAEIEMGLESHPAIRQAIVLAREEVPGDKQLVAYVIAQSGFNEAEVRSYLKQKLPEYMIPVAFVQMDVFPLTPNGKVDRRALPAPQVTSKLVVAPSNEIEAKLLQLWQEILGINSISIHDDFFELGGHSLLVARLFTRLEQEFQCSLPMTVIFQAPTIEQLAIQVVNQSTVPEMPSLIRFKEGTAQPPLFLILAFDYDGELYLNLANQDQSDRAIYGLQFYDTNHTRVLHHRLCNMAAYLIQQMQQIQPEGPYLIGGQCAGGMIAFEMALQLQAQGQEVALVALFDAADAEAKLKPSLYRLKRRLQLSQRKSTVEAAPHPEQIPGEQSSISTPVPQNSSRLTRLIDKAWKKIEGIIKANLLNYHFELGLSLPDYLRSTPSVAIFNLAIKHYKPQTCFDGTVSLFRATEGNGTHDDDPYLNQYEDPLLGWEKRVSRALQVYDVPGGHGSMLDQHNVRATAIKLEEAIQDAIAQRK